MKAKMKIQVNDLSPEWVADIKEKYPNQAIEVKVMPAVENDVLTEALFWQLIDLFDWSKSENADIIAPAVEKLATYPVHYIYLFQDILSEKLYQLDTKAHALQIGEDAWADSQYFSVDQFLYARCCVVANGQKAYDEVVNDATKMPKNLTFEPILSLANKAFELKTGEAFQYFPVCNYETYANQDGWAA